MILGYTGGRHLKQCCLQRCTVFPGPTQSSLPSHEKGFREGVSVHERMDLKKQLDKGQLSPLCERGLSERPF